MLYSYYLFYSKRGELEQQQFNQDINQLQEIANAFNEAQNDTVSTIFHSWASSLIEVVEAKVEVHSFKLEMCNEVNWGYCNIFGEEICFRVLVDNGVIRREAFSPRRISYTVDMLRSRGDIL